MCHRIIFPCVIMMCLMGADGADKSRAAASADDAQAHPRSGPAKPTDPFPLELAFTRRTFPRDESSATSPTGQHVAYAVATPTKQRYDLWTLPSGLLVKKLGTRLRVTEIATGKSTELGVEGATSFTPAWSPDGTKLAYYSDEGGALHAWIFDLTVAKSTRAADVRVKIHMYTPTTLMPPTWSPDGRRLLVPTLPADEVGADPRPGPGFTPEKDNTAQLAVYGKEGHVISEWEPTQAIDATARMLDFLRRHLGTGRDQSNAQ